MAGVKSIDGYEFRAWSFPAHDGEDAPQHWSLSVFKKGKCVQEVPLAFVDERTALLFARLVTELEAALPYVEQTKVPGPAMSDPWLPPYERIKSIKSTIGEAVNGFAVGVKSPAGPLT